SEAVVYGENLAGEIRIATQAPLPLFLGGTSLYLNGMAAPLLFVSPTQINFQIPWELAGLTSATIVVIVDDVVSNIREMRLAPVAPGVFAIGRTQAAAVISATGRWQPPR